MQLKVIKELSGFFLSGGQIRFIKKTIMDSMRAGLDKKPSSLLMINTHVRSLPSSEATGTGLSLDLGSTNFRVLQMIIKDNRLLERVQYYDVDENQRTGTSKQVGNLRYIIGSIY